MHICDMWAGHFGHCSCSCSLSTAWFSAGWETGRNAKLQAQSRAGAELFPMQLPVDSRAGSVRTCPWLGPWVLPAESQPRIALGRQLQFPPGRSGAFRTWRWLPRGCPLSTLALSQECVCCRGITTQRKGKAASLLFLLPALSHISGWERQGPARLKVTSFCCWPRASERETKQDTITRMSNTASLPCRPRLVCRNTGRDQQSRTSSRTKVRQSCYIDFFFLPVFFQKREPPTSAPTGVGVQKLCCISNSAAYWDGVNLQSLGTACFKPRRQEG